MKFLIIGAGSIGTRHAKNLLALGAASEVVVCDLNEDRLNEAKKLGIRTTKDFEKELQEDCAALICTPNNSHVRIAQKAAEAGAHVFVEKPLSHSLNGVEKLVETAWEKKLVSLVGCNLRFNKSLLKVKQLIEEKTIGRILSARIQFGQYLPDWHPLEDYRKGYSAKKDLGGGIVLDAIHEIDYSNWLFGKATEVTAKCLNTNSLDIETEDLAEIILSYENGATAAIHLDYLQRDYVRNAEIIGEEGLIKWDYQRQAVEVFTKIAKKWERTEIAEDKNEMYVAELKHFIECIKGRQQTINDFDSALGTLKIALAAKKSSLEKQSIKL